MNDDYQPDFPETEVDEPEGEAHEVIAVAVGDAEAKEREKIEIPDRLPVLPVRDAVAFPRTVMPLSVNREKSKRVLDLALSGSRLIAVVAQRSPDTEDPKLEDLYRVGTACEILKLFKVSDGTESIIIQGLRRIGVEAITKEAEYLEAAVHPYDDQGEVTQNLEAMMHGVREAALRIVELSPTIPDEAALVLRGLSHPGHLADFLAANLPLEFIQKQELLETFDISDRLRKVHLAITAQLELVELSHKIQEQVRGQVDQTQREYYLREQLKAIREELGEKDTRSETLNSLRTRIREARMPKGVRKEADREVDRMEHIPPASPEYSMALDYLEWLVELPWSTSTKDNLDIKRAQEILDRDHYGLEKVKRRILEFMAVRTLKKDSRGPILCFTGPPGVGKTSLGQSIARAMDRKFVRLSLGGIRDEATIRGHRRTYIGAMPGNIIREIRKAKTNNPLFMLDEVDKIGQDLRGDPMSALLEVLDPAQNSEFLDNYLNVPFDLSGVLFIATGNYMGAIEPALLDRMEIIELSGYTRREKLMIARRHLFPRQLEQNGLKPDQLDLSDEVITAVIDRYTREAGVRELERKLGGVCRSQAAALVRGEKPNPKTAVEDLHDIFGIRMYESEVASNRDVAGVVTGLAFTAVGGEILFIEAIRMPGSGNLRLTGQLGDVMRESGLAAYSLVRSRAGQMKIKPGFFSTIDLHVHVPAGATPKDGPSAGVALLCAMLSCLSDRTVDPLTGMTGEITLSGRVLPVGGVREKVLAAHRAGLERIILPAQNEQDLEEVPEDVRAELEFVFVKSVNDLLAAAFDTKRKRRTAKAKKRKNAAAGRSTRKAKKAAGTSSRKKAKPKAAAKAKAKPKATKKRRARRR